MHEGEGDGSVQATCRKNRSPLRVHSEARHRPLGASCSANGSWPGLEVWLACKRDAARPPPAASHRPSSRLVVQRRRP